jgi:predicted GIY-YIG superfamily endonuclease
MNTLYRFYDSGDSLLYIGITIDPSRRFVEHKQTKPWWANIARITLEHYDDHATLVAAERIAIAIQKPRYNIAMNDGPPVLIDEEALAEGCCEWLDGGWCGAPATHVATPDYNGGGFVCATHARYYTVAIPLPI